MANILGHTSVLFVISYFLISLNVVAQTTGSHTVSVSIPDYMGIRIVGSFGDTSPNLRGVTFDYVTNTADYLNAIQAGGAILPPTQVTAFSDIQVSVKSGRWRVNVQALPQDGFESVSSLALSDISVTPGLRSGLEGTGPLRPNQGNGQVNASWTLSSSPTVIASGQGNTRGWQSLGFNGWDYSLNVQGNEAPGEHRTIVRYTLTAP
jgi:hypothetical protein